MASAYIALYMFFAGAGGGAFLFGALVDFILRVRDVRWLTRVSVVTDAGLVAGPFLVAIGCGFLVLDLGMPDRLLNVFLFPKMSILGIGSWSLALFVATSLGAYALGKIADRGILRWLEILLQAAALVLSVVIMVYSGLYLAMYPSVPLLYTGWTPVLFMASSLVLGLAVLMVIGFVRQEHTGILEALIGLVPADIVLVCAEFVALVVFVAVRWAAGGMARDALSAFMFGGDYGILFWVGIVAAGALLPLVFDISGMRSSFNGAGYIVSSASCSLVGGLCLRIGLLLVAMQFSLFGLTQTSFWM